MEVRPWVEEEILPQPSAAALDWLSDEVIRSFGAPALASTWWRKPRGRPFRPGWANPCVRPSGRLLAPTTRSQIPVLCLRPHPGAYAPVCNVPTSEFGAEIRLRTINHIDGPCASWGSPCG